MKQNVFRRRLVMHENNLSFKMMYHTMVVRRETGRRIHARVCADTGLAVGYRVTICRRANFRYFSAKYFSAGRAHM